MMRKATFLLGATAIALLMVFSACETEDLVSPTIELTGGDMDIVLKSITTFVEPGFIATDDKDGDISTQVIVTGTVDPTKIGAYEIQYSVSDKAGNKTTVKRTVNIIVNQDIYVGDWSVAETVISAIDTAVFNYTATVSKSSVDTMLILAKNFGGFAQTFTVSMKFTKFGAFTIPNQPMTGSGYDGTLEGTGTTAETGLSLSLAHKITYIDNSVENCTGTWTKMK